MSRKGITIFLIISAIVTATLVLLATACVGVFIYNNNYRLTDVDRLPSPDGRYTARLQMVGQPEWPFGAATAKITVQETASGREIESFEASVHDDGCALGPGHWKVEWEADTVHITLSGSEMQPKTYSVALA